jgi:ribosomal-protein-alanine N-acetyltransferase
MSAFMALSGDRVCLRRWRDEDREAFASINADSRVMEFFRGRLNRVESNAMVDHIEKHFSERGFGLWAIEVPGVADTSADQASSTDAAPLLGHTASTSTVQ